MWGERSDFIVGAVLENGEGTEQLFARQLQPYRFELCCIPFFTYGLALGDVVETDDDYTITGVVEPSGRKTVRVWFGDTLLPRDDVADSARVLGALVEWSSTNLLAVSAPDEATADRLVERLEAWSDDGLIWELG